MRMIVDMNEFLLWANCSNNCRFCWQKKIGNQDCLLSESEKLDSISKARERISELHGGDVLIVGGEVYEPTSHEVTEKTMMFFRFLHNRCVSDDIRYLYINTNLLYEDISIIEYICAVFGDIPERLKFTTSYDMFGRFSCQSREKLFLRNLKRITEEFPTINIVVNTILTKQICRSEFSVKKFCEEYNVRLVNLIPYIPIDNNDDMTPSFGEIVSKLKEADNEIPGYLKNYIDNFDIDQEKILWEYHKNVNDYVLCTAEYGECGHNVNFRKVLKSGECFICALKEMYDDLF